jgi:hypothetical protein
MAVQLFTCACVLVCRLCRTLVLQQQGNAFIALANTVVSCKSRNCAVSGLRTLQYSCTDTVTSVMNFCHHMLIMFVYSLSKAKMNTQWVGLPLKVYDMF